MDEAVIESIGKACGCKVYFHRHALHSYRAEGKQRCYVAIYRHGVVRSLGNFKVVAAMSEAQLRSLIASKFAQVTVKGGR